MNETEEKRQQLAEYEGQWSDEYNKGKLEGFNLGVEMARKEFLKIAEQHDDVIMEDGLKCNSDCNMSITEQIKQSLGEKK